MSGRCGCGRGCRGFCIYCTGGYYGLPFSVPYPSPNRPLPFYTTPAFPEQLGFMDNASLGVRMVATRSWAGQIRARPVAYQTYSHPEVDNYPNWLLQQRPYGCYDDRPQQPSWGRTNPYQCYPGGSCHR